MNLAQWLWAAARARPAADALLCGAEVLEDYAGFARGAAAIAAELGDRGVGADDRVGIFMRNTPGYLELLFGIWWAGAVAVPINRKLHPAEAAWILADASAALAVADGDALEALAAETPPVRVVADTSFSGADRDNAMPAPRPRRNDDLAWLFYTSGTTGRPKGVMLSHGNLVAMSLCYPVDVDPVAPGDAALYAAPLSHGAGLYSMIHVRCGARHSVPPSGGFDGDEILDLARELGAVSMFAAPTMVKRLVNHAERRGEKGEGIKTIVYGGGPMYRADIERAMAILGQRFVQIYGQGECPMAITALSRKDHIDGSAGRYRKRVGSVGRAQSAVELRVTDEEGAPLPVGGLGEIEVRGLPVMAGYWNNDTATSQTLRDGWLRTGDIGSLDEDGYLTLSDRSKDVIISGGSNIYPREVEEVLLEHHAVREACVIGLPDAEWGEIVAACIVPASGGVCEETDLDRHCLERIARFKRPRRYIRFAELPKNAYGKILKRELRSACGASVAKPQET